ncbi:recombinase family protein [Vibrio sp. Isolate24]|uniref:recombinase family protein n=1 Tax=Vibrio sp. Isolate24 TaxID=2908534 RepID=UPI001EFD7B3C|nr:recombinase family protein [Vibrio sp. Isolate24]MCG9680495.1 recombinase family protein [Vibrio sp. Isolate24]
MTKIIIPYVRFSSAEQRKGHSLKRQIERIEEYANKNGYTVDNSLNLRDLGLSAYTAKHIEKGSLGVFLEAIEANLIPRDGSIYLCIEQFDRLSRQNVDDAYGLFSKILKSNVNIITLMDEKVYTKDSLTEMVSIISSLLLMQQANIESEKKSERVSAVFKNRLKDLQDGNKVLFASMLPGWIDNVGTKEKPNFVANKKKVTVRLAFYYYISGKTMGEIARIFNKKRFPQIARKRTKNQTNSWNSAKISHLLSNQCVIGQLKIKKTGEIFENYYPSVITLDDWDLVQSMKRTTATVKAGGRKSINIFQGRLFCADCGNKYYFETDTQTTKTKEYRYHLLKCSGRRFHSCDSKTIRYDNLLEIDHLFIKKRSESNADQSLVKELKEKNKNINKELRELEKENQELNVMFESDEISTIAFAKASTVTNNKIDVLKRDLAQNKQSIMLFSNNTKVDKIDKENPVFITKAKRHIKENFAAFIISSKYNSIVSITHSGHISITETPNNHADVIETYSLFKDIKKQIQDNDRKDVLDGKFKEILQALKFYDMEQA